MHRVICIFALLTLGGCGGTAQWAYMPPDEYLRPPKGAVLVHELWPGGKHLSLEARSVLGCDVQIVPARWTGDPLFKCLFLSALANCNGAVDVNGVARHQERPPGYDRTCASRDWSPQYATLAASEDVYWIMEHP